LLATLHHPHIVAIYSFEETDGLPALVLELVEGPPLAVISTFGDTQRAAVGCASSLRRETIKTV